MAYRQYFALFGLILIDIDSRVSAPPSCGGHRAGCAAGNTPYVLQVDGNGPNGADWFACLSFVSICETLPAVTSPRGAVTSMDITWMRAP